MRSAAIVLAAGASTRMGEPKQLVELGGRPLLERVVAAASASRADDIVVVLGAHAELIRKGVVFGRARVVVNPEHAEGMSTSIRAGLTAAGAEVDRVLIILGDQPDVSPALLDQLLEAQAGGGLPAAAASFNGLLHPPVVMARELWGELISLQGDVGCRQLIRGRPDRVTPVPVEVPVDHPVDIDTPEDLRRLRAGR